MRKFLSMLSIALLPLASLSWAQAASQGSGSAQAQGSLDVPAGTEIVIRTNEAIDSKTAQQGQTFSAQVDQAVSSRGNLVIPKGSPAQLVLRSSSGGGALGSANLVLDLQSVTINGKAYTVASSESQQTSKRGIGKNKRTAEMVGGGAVLGTLIGAVAGGGKGAAIGALIGAGGGATAQVLTKGKEVKVPAESVLKFRLTNTLHLQAAG